MGHPIGASGARIVASVVHQLRRRGGGLGIAAICSGGGQGDALLVKRGVIAMRVLVDRCRADGLRHRAGRSRSTATRCCSTTSMSALIHRGIDGIAKRLERDVEQRPHDRRRARHASSSTSIRAPHFRDLDVALAIEAATEDFETKLDLLRDARREHGARRDPRHQHQLDLDHVARPPRRSEARARDRHALHESGPGDAAGRGHSRDCDQRRDGARDRRRSPRRSTRRRSKSRDFPGFIANRILMPMINEAIYALYEGVASIDAIDTVMKLGMNHPMGPLDAGRLHRARHVPCDHERAARRLRRFEVPAVPAAQAIRGGRLARQEIGSRFLRLSRHRPRPGRRELIGEKRGGFDLTDEQREVGDLAREFALRELAPHVAAWDRAHRSRASPLPRSRRRARGDARPRALRRQRRRLRQLRASDRGARARRRRHGGDAVRAFDDLQRDRRRSARTRAAASAGSRELAAGDVLAGFALTEPDAGSDAAAIRRAPCATATRTCSAAASSGARTAATPAS